MTWYQLEPCVAGGLGENTEVDASVSPPRVLRLHYEFEDWEGDAIIESTPCFLVTAAVGGKMMERGLSGFRLRDVEVTTTETFHQLRGNLVLPEFKWLDLTGESEKDDLALDERRFLTVSKRTRKGIKAYLPNCEVTKIERGEQG